MSFSVHPFPSTPDPTTFQRPYVEAGHAPLSAPAERIPNLPHNTPIRAATLEGHPMTVIDGQPDIADMRAAVVRVEVPTPPDGVNVLSSLGAPPAVSTNRLDLAGAAGPGALAQLTATAPRNFAPVQPPLSIAPSGVQDRGDR